MPISQALYEQVAQQFGQAISDETQEFMLKVNEKKIDVAQGPIALYCGWGIENQRSFWSDMGSMNDRDKEGNVTSLFLDSLPIVGSEEPEDQKQRDVFRQGNSLAEWYWVPTGTQGKLKMISFYDDAARFTTKGAVVQSELDAIKLIEDNPAAPAPQGHPHADLWNMTQVQRQTHKGYLTTQYNTLSSMARDAVHIFQQFKSLGEMDVYRDTYNEEDRRPGLRFEYNLGTTGELARTKRPMILIDSIAPQGGEKLILSLSQFLSINFPAADAAIKRGTMPYLAIKLTLKRAPAERGKGSAVIKSTMTTKVFEEGVWIYYNYLTHGPTLKMVDHLLNDPKKGTALEEGMLRLYFECLQPLMETPAYQLKFKQLQERDVSAAQAAALQAGKAPTTPVQAPGPDVKLETPREKNLRIMKEAAQALQANIKQA